MTPEEYEFEYLAAQELDAMRTGKPVRRDASPEWVADAQRRLQEIAAQEHALEPNDMEPVDPETALGGEG